MFDKWIRGFSNYITDEKSLVKSSAEAYIGDIKGFQEYLNDLKLNEPDDVSSTIIIRYMLNLQRSGKNPSTISRHLSSIRCLFQYLRDEGIVKTDPTRNLKPPRKERRKPSVLTENQIGRLLELPTGENEKGARDRAIIQLMYGTGLRVSEIISLSIGDIDLKGKTISIMGRLVPMDSEPRDSIDSYILKYRPDSRPEEPLFTNRSGSRLSRQGLWKIIKSYGSETTPQSIRNSFAVHMLSRGEEPERVGQLLGHSDPSSIHILSEIADGSKD